MKIKITAICPECADTYNTTVETKDPGASMLDIRLLDIDVTEALCENCAYNCAEDDDERNTSPRVSWEKI